MSVKKALPIKEAKLVDASSRMKAFNKAGEKLNNYVFVTLQTEQGKTINTWAVSGNVKTMQNNQKKSASATFNGHLIDLPSNGITIYPQDPKGNVPQPEREHSVQTLLSLITTNSPK